MPVWISQVSGERILTDWMPAASIDIDLGFIDHRAGLDDQSPVTG
jgi:hypothetical protein